MAEWDAREVDRRLAVHEQMAADGGHEIEVKQFARLRAMADLRHALDALAAAEQRAETAERELDAADEHRDWWETHVRRMVRELDVANQERDTLRARLAACEAVVQWYADPATYMEMPFISSVSYEPLIQSDRGTHARVYFTAHPPRGAAGSGATGEAQE
jgi:chromosome segregation ATPase